MNKGIKLLAMVFFFVSLMFGLTSCGKPGVGPTPGPEPGIENPPAARTEQKSWVTLSDGIRVIRKGVDTTKYLKTNFTIAGFVAKEISKERFTALFAPVQGEQVTFTMYPSAEYEYVDPRGAINALSSETNATTTLEKLTQEDIYFIVYKFTQLRRMPFKSGIFPIWMTPETKAGESYRIILNTQFSQANIQRITYNSVGADGYPVNPTAVFTITWGLKFAK